MRNVDLSILPMNTTIVVLAVFEHTTSASSEMAVSLIKMHHQDFAKDMSFISTRFVNSVGDMALQYISPSISFE